MSPKPYTTTPEDAGKIAEWLRTRGGIAIWEAIDLSRAGQTMTTPATTANGEPARKPAYWLASEPAYIVTDPAEVFVYKDVEVKRFHVAVRMGGNGLKLKVSDGGSRRIRAEVAKAGEDAYHTFDYSTQEAVIMKPESKVPLLDFLASTEKAAHPYSDPAGNGYCFECGLAEDHPEASHIRVTPS
jgi:hypothetical protein